MRSGCPILPKTQNQHSIRVFNSNPDHRIAHFRVTRTDLDTEADTEADVEADTRDPQRVWSNRAVLMWGM